jgi:hypothetical protein
VSELVAGRRSEIYTEYPVSLEDLSMRIHGEGSRTYPYKCMCIIFSSRSVTILRSREQMIDVAVR